jgi:GDP-4-dehydro-6-deoxy-D-mannose reductase
VQEVLDVMLARSRVPIEVKVDPDKMRPSDVPVSVSDIARIREQIGWQAQIPFEQSVEDVLAYWRVEAQKRLPGAPSG